MKKISLILALAIIAFALFGCTEKNTISDDTWILKTAFTENSIKSGYNIAERADITQEQTDERVKYVFCTLTAQNGTFEISDTSTHQSFVGAYSVISKDLSGTTTYKITIDSTVGTAVVGSVKYANGTSEPTLIVSISGYTLNFFTK